MVSHFPNEYEIRCAGPRSEEHTSELQSLRHLVCRLLLEKKTFERAAHDFSRRPEDGGTRLVGGREGAAVEPLEHVRPVEVGDRDLGAVDGSAIGVAVGTK